MVDAGAPELEIDPKLRGELLGRIMRRQAGLSLRVAAIFVAILIALPLINLYAPDIAALDVRGFTLTWLFLGVLFFPITWGLSYVFVKKSEKLESDIVADTEPMFRAAKGAAVDASEGASL